MPPTTLSYSVFGSQGPSGGRSSTPSRWKGMRPSTTVTCAPQEQRAPNTLSFGMPVRSPVSPSPPYGQGRSAIWPPPPSVVRASAMVACGGPSIHTPSVVTGSYDSRPWERRSPRMLARGLRVQLLLGSYKERVFAAYRTARSRCISSVRMLPHTLQQKTQPTGDAAGSLVPPVPEDGG